MKSYAESNQKDKHASSARTGREQSSAPAFRFEESHSMVAQMRKLQNLASSNPRAQQLKSLQAMANNSAQTMRLSRFQRVENDPVNQLRQMPEEVNSNVLQGAFWDSVGLGALGAMLGYAVGTYVTGGLGLFAASLISGAIGFYEGQDVETEKVEGNTEEKKDNKLEIFYSETLLGHFTMIITKPDNSIVRTHFVLDEETRTGVINKVSRKMKQISGYSKGKVLTDNIEVEKLQREYSIDNKKQSLGVWSISDQQVLKVLGKIDRDIQISPNYGYVIYSKNVENCGSFVVKVLGDIGLSITLPRYKTWLLMPRLIKGEVKSGVEKAE